VFVDIIEMPRIAGHGALVVKNIVSMIGELATGAEGGDIMLGHVDPKTAMGSELLLA